MRNVFSFGEMANTRKLHIVSRAVCAWRQFHIEF